MYDNIIEKIKKIENGFKKIEREAKFIFYENSVDNCFTIAKQFYSSEFYQARELSTFICSLISCKSNEALLFLKEIVSLDDN